MPSLELPTWLPLIFVGLLSSLATTLADGLWLKYALATSAGTFAGLFLGGVIWPDQDPISRSYSGLIVVVVTLLSVLISAISGFAARKASKLIGHRRKAIWTMFICCAAYGPIVLLVTPPIAARRVAHNETLAAKRFWALKDSAEIASAGIGTPERTCDEDTLKKRYNGPPFAESTWRHQRIAENDEYVSVRGGGYVFGIWCYQSKRAGYVIDAHPEREKEDGTRQFCTDESREMGCNVEWNGTRNICKPCPK